MIFLSYISEILDLHLLNKKFCVLCVIRLFMAKENTYSTYIYF